MDALIEASHAEDRVPGDEAPWYSSPGTENEVARGTSRPDGEPSFSRLADEWREHRRADGRRVSDKDRSLLAIAVAAFGDRPAADVSGADVQELLQVLVERGMPGIARQLRSKISAVYRYGKRYLAIRTDPAAALPHCLLHGRRVRRYSASTGSG